jgi:hypothetical protein
VLRRGSTSLRSTITNSSNATVADEIWNSRVPTRETSPQGYGGSGLGRIKKKQEIETKRNGLFEHVLFRVAGRWVVYCLPHKLPAHSRSLLCQPFPALVSHLRPNRARFAVRKNQPNRSLKILRPAPELL